MNRQLLQTFNPLTVLSRSKGYKAPGGIRYPGGIVYYPRNPETYTDPEYTPSKLFRVERIKTSKHFPWWQKKILDELKINEKNRVTVVKNIPEINMRLWKVKHLIKVTPITFPYGEPTEEDINYTVLKENGQCLVTKTLKPQESQIEALDKFDMDAKKMDSTTIKKDSREKWNIGFSGGF
ncbi:large ribosomal subunit protein uL30m [Plodia interpunctella]|uniref:large ribosomal subunit protein uL30m n=1 Tax=Plodia interpunctella TaxID=58824 RepID=UPI0023675F53|nr:39S ribosomal protein L30, mitochondrial [Plodia interpunctella]